MLNKRDEYSRMHAYSHLLLSHISINYRLPVMHGCGRKHNGFRPYSHWAGSVPDSGEPNANGTRTVRRVHTASASRPVVTQLHVLNSWHISRFSGHLSIISRVDHLLTKET